MVFKKKYQELFIRTRYNIQNYSEINAIVMFYYFFRFFFFGSMWAYLYSCVVILFVDYIAVVIVAVVSELFYTLSFTIQELA